MEATQLIKQHLDVEKILEHYDFDGIHHHGDMIRAKCKMHGGVNPTSFIISDEGLWYCHAGICGGGDIYTLVQKFEECGFPESVRKVADLLGIDITNLTITERKKSYEAELRKWIRTMSSRTKKKVKEEFVVTVPIKEVTKFRSFEQETMQHFGLGYIEEIFLKKRDGGAYSLKDRLSFPIIFDGMQVGLSLRKTKAKDFPKWSHQPVSLETGDILYNYDAVSGKTSITIVEGMLDVWAFHEIGVTAVATFGAHITEEQYRLLMRTGADLVLAFDGDQPGQVATQKAIDMFRYKANVERVLFHEDEDPESIPRNELKLKYESRVKA